MPYRTRRERRYRRRLAKAVAIEPAKLGGWGKDSIIGRGDWLLIRQAIRERWDVPAATRKAVCDRIGDLLDNAETRMLTAIARAALAMEDDNLRQIEVLLASIRIVTTNDNSKKGHS